MDVLLRPLSGGAGTILMFHRVRPPDPDFGAPANRQNCIPEQRLRTLLDWLAHRRIDVVSLDEAAAREESGARERFVCLTFDDGYRDNHDTLLPIAQNYHVPVTIYVTPGLIDGTAPLWWYGLDSLIQRETSVRLPLDADTPLPCRTTTEKATSFAAAAEFMLRAGPRQTATVVAAMRDRYGVDFPQFARIHMMNWDMIRAMAASPLVEIGAHTMTHPPLAHRDYQEARSEMADSRDRLAAETGRPIRHFAYPFGTAATVGPREATLAAELGFHSAVTSRAGHLRSGQSIGRYAWPRVGIGPDDGPAQLKLKLAGAAALRARLAVGE